MLKLLCPAVALFASLSPLIAADNVLTNDEKKQGWTLLFDGKTLNGWTDPAKKTPPGTSWNIEEGCIHSTSHPALREDLLTNRSFGNFELVFDWRISKGGNSGLKYRIQDEVVLQRGKTKPGAKKFEETVDYEYEHRLADRSKLTAEDHIEDYPIALEYQVIDNLNHPDAKRGAKQSAGALYSMVAPVSQQAKPLGEFNTSKIVLKDNHVEHWLNGVKVVDTTFDNPEIASSLASRWGKESIVYKLLTTQPKKSTPIALQNHNDEAWFKNIKIHPLP